MIYYGREEVEEMKKMLFILIPIILISGTFLGCNINNGDSIEGSGTVIVIEEDFTDFYKVNLATAFEGTITQNHNFSVLIRIDDNLEEYLNVKLSGDTLKIFLDGEHRYHVITLEADITMPDLEAITLSGASSADVSGFESDHDFDFSLSGASRVNGDLVAAAVDIELSGASKLSLEGNGVNMDIDASGASSVDLGGFMAENIYVSLSGASDATVNLDGTLDADLSGASKLQYYGNPAMGDIETSGASSIKSAS